MVKILVDTCVWLDMAKGADQNTFLTVIEEMVKMKEVEFVVPQIVIEEFKRNKEKIAKDGVRSMASTFSRVIDVVKDLANPDEKQAVINRLNDFKYKLPTLIESANFNIVRIEKILQDSHIIHTKQDVLLRAAQRAIDKRAPFHLNKNSMADAVLMEIYSDCIKEKTTEWTQFAFVTHNKTDFSSINEKLPHHDFEDCFFTDDIDAHVWVNESRYFIKLLDALRQFSPELVSDLEAEQEWEQTPRNLTEILKAHEELVDKLWYDRHQVLAFKIKTGEIKLIDSKDWSPQNSQSTCIKEVWQKAKAAAKKKEQVYGKVNLGPYDKFEWGMLNGKLSAIRWVMGDDWDFLDT